MGIKNNPFLVGFEKKCKIRGNKAHYNQKDCLKISMMETLEHVKMALQKGHNLEALQHMHTQWNSINHFSKLYTFLSSEMQNLDQNCAKIIKNYNCLLKSESEKDYLKQSKANLRIEDKVYTRSERKERIRRYILKKKNRKKKYFIRYEIRKTLANSRLREKGKFIKNKKIDINKLIEMVKAGRIYYYRYK